MWSYSNIFFYILLFYQIKIKLIKHTKLIITQITATFSYSSINCLINTAILRVLVGEFWTIQYSTSYSCDTLVTIKLLS